MTHKLRKRLRVADLKHSACEDASFLRRWHLQYLKNWRLQYLKK